MVRAGQFGEDGIERFIWYVAPRLMLPYSRLDLRQRVARLDQRNESTGGPADTVAVYKSNGRILCDLRVEFVGCFIRRRHFDQSLIGAHALLLRSICVTGFRFILFPFQTSRTVERNGICPIRLVMLRCL